MGQTYVEKINQDILKDVDESKVTALNLNNVMGDGDQNADTQHEHHANNIEIDASGFSGNLSTSDDTPQKVAEKVDTLAVGGGGGGSTELAGSCDVGSYTQANVLNIQGDSTYFSTTVSQTNPGDPATVQINPTTLLNNILNDGFSNNFLRKYKISPNFNLSIRSDGTYPTNLVEVKASPTNPVSVDINGIKYENTAIVSQSIRGLGMSAFSFYDVYAVAIGTNFNIDPTCFVSSGSQPYQTTPPSGNHVRVGSIAVAPDQINSSDVAILAVDTENKTLCSEHTIDWQLAGLGGHLTSAVFKPSIVNYNIAIPNGSGSLNISINHSTQAAVLTVSSTVFGTSDGASASLSEMIPGIYSNGIGSLSIQPTISISVMPSTRNYDYIP